MSRATGRVTGALAATLFASLILFPNLGGYALWDPDEARHAEIAREASAARDWRGWIVPSFNARPYHEKPILFYWAVSAADAIGGTTEGAARAVSAIAALLTVLAVYAWGAAVWGTAAGLASAVVLVTAVEFVGLGRYASLDMLLTLWVTAGLLALHRWTSRPETRAWLGLAAVAAALGALTKGLVAPVLIGGIGVAYLAATGGLGVLRLWCVAGALAVFVLVAAPWYVAAAFLEPGYMRDFLVEQQAARFLGQRAHFHRKGAYFPWVMVVAGFFPWSVLLPATLRDTLARGRRNPAEVFCAVWAMSVLVFFTVSRGKLGGYILPALPPLALLTGRFLGRLHDQRPEAEAPLLRGAVFALAGAFLLLVPLLVAITWRLYDGVWGTTSLLATAAIPLALVLLALVRRRRLDLVPLTIGLGMLALVGVFYRWGAPQMSAVYSDEPIARLIAPHLANDDPAPVLAYGVRSPSLIFYLRHPVKQAVRPAKLAKVLATNPLVFVVTNRRHVPELEATGRLYPWRTAGHHVLYASQPRDG